MSYKMTIKDSVSQKVFNLLEVPIIDKDVEGMSDNTTLDGNVYTDYMWSKKSYEQSFSFMFDDDYADIRAIYMRQYTTLKYPTLKIENITNGATEVIVPETVVRLSLSDGGVINNCKTRQNVKLVMRETAQQ